MSDEVKNATQLRVGLIKKILSEWIFIRVDQAPWKFFRWDIILLLCRELHFGETPYIWHDICGNPKLRRNGCNAGSSIPSLEGGRMSEYDNLSILLLQSLVFAAFYQM
jgi:hypothetical protein